MYLLTELLTRSTARVFFRFRRRMTQRHRPEFKAEISGRGWIQSVVSLVVFDGLFYSF